MQPPYAARPPSPGAIISGVLSDTLPLMRSRQTVYLILAAIAAVCALALLHTLPSPRAVNSQRADIAFQTVNLLGVIALFFTIPNIIRTLRPDFRMTFGKIVMLTVFNIGAAICIDIGLVLLIVPGVFLLVRWSQLMWTYLEGGAENPYAGSWRLTAGYFWPTLLFFIVVSLVACIAGAIALGVPLTVPSLGVIALPFALLAYVALLHFIYLAYFRWYVMLTQRQPGAIPDAFSPVAATPA